MVVRNFPSPRNTERGECVVSKRFGLENIIVNASAKDIAYNNISSPLSFKYTISGNEWYNFGGREVLVDNQHFLLLDNQRTYSTFIRSDTAVESFCIFFANDILNELFTFHQSNPEILLDNPHILKEYDQPIIEKRFKIDHNFLQLLTSLKESVDTGDTQLLDDKIYPLLNKIFSTQFKLKEKIAQLPYQKKSTQIELYKRVTLAKDYIDSCLTETPDLDTLAKLSHLSKFHFLRVFREIYGISPHKYLVKKKLEYSIELIREGNSIAEVSRKIGFSNSASFCRLFKQHFGQSPGSYDLH